MNQHLDTNPHLDVRHLHIQAGHVYHNRIREGEGTAQGLEPGLDRTIRSREVAEEVLEQSRPCQVVGAANPEVGLGDCIHYSHSVSRKTVGWHVPEDTDWKMHS